MCENEIPGKPPRCHPTIPYGGVEKVWRETQQLMEKSERLFRIMTHVCPQQLTGVFRTVAKYSQGCWRRCTADAGEHRGPRAQQEQQQEQHCGRCECRRVAMAGQEEGEGEGVPEDGSYLWRGWRRRRGGCQCQPSTNMDTWGSAGPPPPADHHLCYPAHTHAQESTRSHTPKWRTSLPSHSSILTILLLLVVTLARFSEGCSSRSTPKPRPPSPTMRPNITFQTYACPPAYAAWYCLNGATCFTVKIGESILYNCECADGYMGQRCEFKDLDGSYLPTREKVLLETASIAGGATVACVLVFVVLFAAYVLMQRGKDKRCRELDDGRGSDRQPFTGYQNPRPEIIRTISNPYARTLEELSHVEVQPTKPASCPVSVKDNPSIVTTTSPSSSTTTSTNTDANTAAAVTTTNTAHDPS